MDAKALSDLFAEQVEVQVEGRTLTLRSPSLAEASGILTGFGAAAEKLPEGSDARVPYLSAVASAIDLTLVVDGERPEGLGRRILLGTGGLSSPVGQAAARLTGLPLIGTEAVPDDIPT